MTATGFEPASRGTPSRIARLFGVGLVFLIWLIAGASQPAVAQTGQQTCCNTATGEWTADSPAACNAKPGHVAFTPANPAGATACFLRPAEEAFREMGIDPTAYLDLLSSTGAPAIPNIPGMPDVPGMTPTPAPAAAEPECCNLTSGQWAGAMAPDACRARANHVPDTPDYLDRTQVCRPSQGGGAWSVEEYEPNIENGGMETWRDEHRPEGFTTFAPAPEIASSAMADFQVAFRDTDAHTGEYSLRLRNFDFMTQLPPETAQIVRGAVGAGATVVPAGAFTCEEPCASETGTPPSDNTMSGALDLFGSLASDDVKSHVCGAYKGYIAVSDQLVLRVQVSNGGSAVPGSAVRTFTDSAADWVEFAMPMTSIGEALPASGQVGIVAQITARGSDGTAVGMHNVSALTEVKIDSIHFCDPMGLTAFHPAVIAGGTGMAVPESEEETLGVQTFVNLDNDDTDGEFDLADSDGVAGDDELVRIRLELPMNSFGTVELTAANVGTNVQLWDDANRTRPFELYNREVEVEELLRANAQGTRFIRDVWIEALTPSATPGDNGFEFIFKNRLNNDEVTRDRIVLTAIGIENLLWQGQGNGLDDTDTLDPDPTWPATATGPAVRVFPGRRWAGSRPEDEARNTVTVRVMLNVAPPRPVKFYFRAFDIDDPTAHDNEVDRETEAEDNRGDTPNRWGGFPNIVGEIRELEVTGQTGEFEFQTTLQPGDNFRIAGNGDRTFLEQLENDDRLLAELGPVHATKIVDRHVLEATGRVGDARIRQHEAYTTETLTVWRKLYIEMDTMGPVAGNSVEATITVDRADAETTAASGTPLLQYWLRLDTNLYAALPADSQMGIAGFANNYVGGRMTLGGLEYAITAHTTNAGNVDEIRVSYPSSWGAFTERDNGSLVTLRDDDTLRNGDPLPPIPMQGVAPAFAPAYVLPVYEGGPVAGAPPNTNRERPFLLHFGSDDVNDLKLVFGPGFDRFDDHENPEIWIVYLLNAFQGQLKEDGDGDVGISGHADGPTGGMGAVIYQESGRETALAYAAYGTRERQGDTAGHGWRLQDTPPHEIAHLFGAFHEDGGMMSYDPIKTVDFTPVTLDRIRSARNP